VAALVAALVALVPAAAQAHPLGNFTVNHYSRIELSPERLRVRYVVDAAEIPTFQAMATLDANADGTVNDAEKKTYLDRQLAEITRNLQLSLNDVRVPLAPGPAELELVPGQGGLLTMRLVAWLEAPAAAPILTQSLPRDGAVRLDYRDGNAPERIGWREMLVKADGVAVTGSAGGSAPTKDVSDELRAYPDDLLQSPLDVRRLRLTVALGSVPGSASDEVPGSAPSAEAGWATLGGGVQSLGRSRDGFAELISSATLTPAVVALALLTAVMLGGMHALSPGHGKTIVGAYLIGSRGTPKHALFLGLTVTLVHTAGVFALLGATLFASQYVVPERIFPWMSFISGALVLWIGLTLVRSRWMHTRRGDGALQSHQHVVDRDHVSGASDHGASEASHSHGFGSHTHAVPGADGRPVTWGSLLALGVSGGLLPCPSALVLGLGAIALNRVAYGLVLILFFSAGLAATLMAIGLTMVYSGRAAGRLRLLERLGARAGGGTASRLLAGARALPVASAAVVALAGLALTADALRQLDLPAQWASSAGFRGVAANLLSLSVGALAVFFALRRRPTAAAPVAGATAAAHGHGHLHPHGNNLHAHDHAHAHDHGHVPGDYDGDHNPDRAPPHEHPVMTTKSGKPAYVPADVHAHPN
jgi:ABC-type nickel/cobalt efflux system permease component RcnA